MVVDREREEDPHVAVVEDGLDDARVDAEAALGRCTIHGAGEPLVKRRGAGVVVRRSVAEAPAIAGEGVTVSAAEVVAVGEGAAMGGEEGAFAEALRVPVAGVPVVGAARAVSDSTGGGTLSRTPTNTTSPIPQRDRRILEAVAHRDSAASQAVPAYVESASDRLRLMHVSQRTDRARGLRGVGNLRGFARSSPRPLGPQRSSGGRMSVEAVEIGDEGLGAHGAERYADLAVAGARALIEYDASQERWVMPLVRAILRKRLRLPSLSPTTHRVVRLIEQSEVDLDELAQAVNGDPVLATRIMASRTASYFRGATEVPNVREALMRMGVREARTLVVVVALRSTLLRSPGLGEMAQQLWRHSLLTASATQEIAQELPPWETTGFLAGLLHDLGQLVVLAFVAELPAWQDDGASPSASTVEAMLDATHHALGAMVLASWGFPEAFCDAILAHHDADTVEGEARTLAQAMDLGHAIATGSPTASRSVRTTSIPSSSLRARRSASKPRASVTSQRKPRPISRRSRSSPDVCA